jgi:hypothetical protein
MFSRRVVVLIASIVVVATVGGVAIYLSYFGGSGGRSDSGVGFFAYKNADVDSKINALTYTFVEFSAEEYVKVEMNDTEYVWMSPTQDDWDGVHFVFDLSRYNLDELASVRFTWVGRVIEPENCDCMELWYYKDSGWVKLDDINQSVWMTKTEKWTSDLADYIDDEGKVHVSVVVHVKRGQPLDVFFAYLLTQFVNLEVSHSD